MSRLMKLLLVTAMIAPGLYAIGADPLDRENWWSDIPKDVMSENDVFMITEGGYTKDKLGFKYEIPTPSPIGTFLDYSNFIVLSNKSGRTEVLYMPCIGLGNAVDDYRVRIYPGGDKADKVYGSKKYMHAEFMTRFMKGTKHGGFDIRDVREEVEIIARASDATGLNEVRIERKPGQAHPFVIIGGDGEVRSGNCTLNIQGRNIAANQNREHGFWCLPEDKSEKNGRGHSHGKTHRGSTPLEILIVGWPYRYSITRDGQIRKQKCDWPTPVTRK